MLIRVGIVARGTVLARLACTFVNIGCAVLSFKARLACTRVSIIPVGAAVICFAVLAWVTVAFVTSCVAVVTKISILTCAGVDGRRNFMAGSGVGTSAVHARAGLAFIDVCAGHAGGLLVFVFPGTSCAARVISLSLRCETWIAVDSARISGCTVAAAGERFVGGGFRKACSHGATRLSKAVRGGTTDLRDCCAHPPLVVGVLVDHN